jgi:putative ABC transport system permease protein
MIGIPADAAVRRQRDPVGVSFTSFVLRNLSRQRTRSLLTIVGITIGITTVVALGAITAGFERAAGDVARLGGADLMVAQRGAADLSFSTLPVADLRTVEGVEGVAGAAGALFHIDRVGSNPFFFAMGVEAEAIPRFVPRLAIGAYPAGASEILLGAQAADDLDARPGATVQIGERSFRVSGVYESSGVYERGGGYLALDAVQELTGKRGVLSAVYVTAARGADLDALAARIEATSDRFAAIRNADDYSEVDQGLKILDAANLAISVLAIAIGAIGVMNTMIMAVFERTREIGVLRAVGWRSSRVARMVIGESLSLCLVAAVIGTALGIAATQAVAALPTIGNFLQPTYHVELFLRALAVAVGVSLVGAAYPAIRAVRLSPMEALRHE